jgi:hypothetical protein
MASEFATHTVHSDKPSITSSFMRLLFCADLPFHVLHPLSELID